MLITGLFSWDGGFVLFLMSQNALATVAICIVKSTVAGYLCGLVYEFVSKKNQLLGVVLAAIVCPVVNTGLFIVGMMVFFYDFLVSSAGGQSVIYFVIFGLVGINFLVELVTNVVLSSAISRIIGIGKKM